MSFPFPARHFEEASELPGLFIDNFAGGGGASTGIERALGRPVDIAINHDPEAVAMHAANHPETYHYCQNIWQAIPRDVVQGRPVDGIWFSPDCKHHSKAKGGVPREKGIRDLGWTVPLWLDQVQPKKAYLENVEEFQDWGPLDFDTNLPIPERKGETFGKWVRAIKRAGTGAGGPGYWIEWRELRACDYGVPTTRKRLYAIISRKDCGRPAWPAPTHGHPDSEGVKAGRLKPWNVAADCIDFTLPCPSIFDRRKPLAENTLRRIAHGVMRFVVNNPRCFIVPVTHTGDSRVHDGLEPFRTITTANGGELALVDASVVPIAAMSMIQTGYGERPGQKPRVLDLGRPTGTAVDGCKQALVAAFLTKYRQGSDGAPMDAPAPTVTANGHSPRSGAAAPIGVVVAHMMQNNTGMVGHPMASPVSTIVGKGCTQSLVATSLVKLRGTSRHGQPSDVPLHTISAGGEKGGIHFAQVAAFLVKYFGAADHGQAANDPLHTVTALPRFGLVTVTIEGEEYVIVDIGMRMLTPRELARAQGFPDSYQLEVECDRVVRGKTVRSRLPKAAQIRMIGNSVCPTMAELLVAANHPFPVEERLAA